MCNHVHYTFLRCLEACPGAFIERGRGLQGVFAEREMAKDGRKVRSPDEKWKKRTRRVHRTVGGEERVEKANMPMQPKEMPMPIRHTCMHSTSPHHRRTVLGSFLSGVYVDIQADNHCYYLPQPATPKNIMLRFFFVRGDAFV